MKNLVKFIFGVVILLPVITYGQDNFNMRLLAQKPIGSWRWVTDIESDGEYVYLAGGEFGIQVIDPARPQSKNCLEVLRQEDFHISKLERNGGLLLAQNNWKVQLIDLSDTPELRIISTIDSVAPFCSDGNYIHAIRRNNYLLYSIDNPSEPQLISQINNLVEIESICAENDLVCVAGGNQSIYVIDVSDRENPIQISTLNSGGRLHQMKMIDSKLYYLTTDQHWHVFDLSDPRNFNQIADIALPHGSYDFYFFDSHFAIIAGDGNAYVFDNQNPQEPRQIGSVYCDLEGWVPSICYSNGRLFVGQYGLHVIDATNLTELSFLSYELGLYTMTDMEIRDNLLYVGYQDGGVRIYDIENIEMIEEIAALIPNRGVSGIALDSSRNLYAFDRQSDSVYVLGPNGDQDWRRLATMNLNVQEMVARGDTAYAALSGSNPVAINISDPNDPRVIGNIIERRAICYDIEILGNTAFGAYFNGGLWSFDIRDVANIRELGNIGTSEVIYKICGRDNYIVGIQSHDEFWAGIYLYDCSDPAHPRRVWGVLSADRPRDIINAPDRNVVFSAESEDGVRCFRVVDDLRLWERGYYDTPGEALALAIDRNRLFVGDGTFIQVIDVSDAYNTVAEDPIPVDFSISDPYPNPFNSTTSVQISIPTSQHVQLNLVDVSGKIVRTTDYGRLSTGSHCINVDAGNLASGIYFAQFNIGARKYLQRAVLMR